MELNNNFEQAGADGERPVVKFQEVSLSKLVKEGDHELGAALNGKVYADDDAFNDGKLDVDTESIDFKKPLKTAQTK